MKTVEYSQNFKPRQLPVKTKFKKILIPHSRMCVLLNVSTHKSLLWIYRSTKTDWTKKPFEYIVPFSPLKWGGRNKNNLKLATHSLALFYWSILCNGYWLKRSKHEEHTPKDQRHWLSKHLTATEIKNRYFSHLHSRCAHLYNFSKLCSSNWPILSTISSPVCWFFALRSTFASSWILLIFLIILNSNGTSLMVKNSLLLIRFSSSGWR